MLLLPTAWIGFAVQDPGTNYAVFAAIALLCGLGAGNFSSSMANISFFYPKRLQGTALGLNAGVGNLGVGLAQIVAPIAMYGGALWIMGGSAQTRVDQGATMSIWVQNAGFIWVPLIVAAAVAAWFGMDNIATVRAGFAEQVAIVRHKQQWRMSWLYTGTFGSFIGLAAGFPMLVNTEFPAADAFKFAFIGPVLAALVRPLGGWLADRMGGAIITVWIFVVMAVAPLVAALFLPSAGGSGSLLGFVLAFIALFIAAGVGNGSTFRMIPIIFRTLREREVSDGNDQAALDEARRVGSTEGAATLGFSSAIAAFGGFFIPIAYGTSIDLTGSPQGALVFFSLFYLSCVLEPGAGMRAGTPRWRADRVERHPRRGRALNVRLTGSVPRMIVSAPSARRIAPCCQAAQGERGGRSLTSRAGGDPSSGSLLPSARNRLRSCGRRQPASCARFPVPGRVPSAPSVAPAVPRRVPHGASARPRSGSPPERQVPSTR